MLKPYQTIGRALALFKAAGLAVPAYGEEEKRRLLDVWVQRYGALDSELFLKCSERLASGQRFPRFYDMDAALREGGTCTQPPERGGNAAGCVCSGRL